MHGMHASVRLQAVSARGRHGQGGGGQSARLFVIGLILEPLLVGAFSSSLHTVTRKWPKEGCPKVVKRESGGCGGCGGCCFYWRCLLKTF